MCTYSFVNIHRSPFDITKSTYSCIIDDAPKRSISCDGFSKRFWFDDHLNQSDNKFKILPKWSSTSSISLLISSSFPGICFLEWAVKNQALTLKHLTSFDSVKIQIPSLWDITSNNFDSFIFQFGRIFSTRINWSCNDVTTIIFQILR